jgi:hypothetical protein
MFSSSPSFAKGDFIAVPINPSSPLYEKGEIRSKLETI